MTEAVKTDNTPSASQLESWRKLWQLLLDPTPAPESKAETDGQADSPECSTPLY
jgi:hypothetical protein